MRRWPGQQFGLDSCWTPATLPLIYQVNINLWQDYAIGGRVWIRIPLFQLKATTMTTSGGQQTDQQSSEFVDLNSTFSPIWAHKWIYKRPAASNPVGNGGKVIWGDFEVIGTFK